MEPAIDADVIFDALERVRRTVPRVHVITNTVAQTLTANVLLALGAVPSMTIAPAEVAAFAESADALLINLGTLDEDRRQAIPRAVHAASAAGRPCVLDPVFIDRSPRRAAYARKLLHESWSAIRVNAAELDALGGTGSTQAANIGFSPVLAVTGSVDRVQDSTGRAASLANGHPLMGRTTATGCAGGAVLAAFLSCSDDPFASVCAGLSVFNVAGEIAAARARGPGSLVPELLDALYRLQRTDIQDRLAATLDPTE
ncbi:putative hydroxyethylthiazole kinase [Roseibium aquae]|uniref:Hydroxyethylthiazole kinase n=1 Tax=Roseibium aquae TaxID=1323746 RepID=A0A916WX75_9HYPH|nr:hydroxyethylthiazole kinase [Roseibium aquae]GGB36977.1 putative hydroxyethylthiazole kinase [Roseibium aquae]